MSDLANEALYCVFCGTLLTPLGQGFYLCGNITGNNKEKDCCGKVFGFFKTLIVQGREISALTFHTETDSQGLPVRNAPLGRMLN